MVQLADLLTHTLCVAYISSISSKKNLTFLGFANIETATIANGAHWIAIQEINDNADLLPNYTLHYKAFDTQQNVQYTLRQALTIIGYESTEDNIYSPITLGPDWSALSVTSTPVLNSFDMGAFSSTSTSSALSDDEEYPYFYRYYFNTSILHTHAFAM